MEIPWKSPVMGWPGRGLTFGPSTNHFTVYCTVDKTCLIMSSRPSQPPPPLPTFPDRLSLSNAIWETVIGNEEDEEMDLEEMEETEAEEFMDDGFREDLRKLEVRVIEIAR